MTDHCSHHTDPNYTPTIEQVAEALGEPFAHLAPRVYWDHRPAAWWYVCDVYGPLTAGSNATDQPAYFRGPTRADALRAAWAYVTTQPEPTS